MLHKHYYILLIISFIALGSCKQKKEEILELPSNTSEALNLKYAEGFTITNNQNFKVVEIKNPWPKADKTYKYVLISKENIAKTSFLKDEYDGIIITPVTKIVVTSTTHIPALELLDKTETLVGFPGTDYVSSKQTRQRIDNGQVKELGKNEGLNTEVLLNLNPDLVIGFGVDGTSKSLNTVKKANIPVIYNGDWVEKSPLAKAEWIKLFGAIFNKQQQADSIFNTIESNYNKAKQLAKTVTKKPTVISGALYKDVWYLPSGTSTEAQLLKDANLDYLYANTNASGSLSLSFEAVFEKAKQANLWISPSYYNSLQSLEDANAHYTNFEAFKTKSVFSFTNTVGPTGGVLYYETGFARPDLVLKDLIKIGHPELLNDYEPYFFKPLK
ncbi:Vitamin B12 ABC transporter, substrate-binding protein BtuF [Mesoflavibacter sp. HG96]|uniref:ABC transporter substrate-binding protein n=1 Tax=unclassified Mesoflavibacter TaxID=2630131 RepID=UPI000D10E742|nr:MULTISPECIES: ABC transporter substrate-binding protein [unclassified Mesoflavibacter]QIJ87891.1 Vitamin B12 ABC transporter, substrate-binding protein BtuF [Mesoflavibacter sp. HG96]QIJ90619.1 Vitamin B12 ABC transporter, substrate-binding protein BtuF [Mesoflavibacter sp. HG37]